jgi:ATP-dependent Clp protease adaptor protein ClpS
MSTTDTIIEEKTVTSKKIKQPSRYKVIVYNDDVTPIDFVIVMLCTIFKHSVDSATEITLKIHNQGSALAGIYSHEIAEQKTLDATSMAKENGYPLSIKMEAE